MLVTSLSGWMVTQTESHEIKRERRTEAHAPTSASSDLVENRIISFLYLFLLFDNEL